MGRSFEDQGGTSKPAGLASAEERVMQREPPVTSQGRFRAPFSFFEIGENSFCQVGGVVLPFPPPFGEQITSILS
jgi:hypothetical protein